MGLCVKTDTSGEVTFLLPADGGNSTNYNGYRFRADYGGTQTWSDSLLVTVDVSTPVEVDVGGSTGLFSPPSREGVQLASLAILPSQFPH